MEQGGFSPWEALRGGTIGGARHLGMDAEIGSLEVGKLDTLRVDQAAELCLDRCLELGGRPYLYGWHRLDDTTLERLYGDDLRRLCALRRELDPEGLFQPTGPLAGSGKQGNKKEPPEDFT